MSKFTFTSTAQCEYCGTHLSSSDEECDHGGESVDTHVFRRMGGGRESMEGVESTIRYKWHALAEKLGEEWKAYEWLGTKQWVVQTLNSDTGWDTVEELPKRAMSLDAPRDVWDDE